MGEKGGAVPRDYRCLLFLLALTGVTTGCTTFGKSSRWAGDGPPKQSEPDVDGLEDKWGFVGKEARGNRALEDEKDPFKPFLMSKEAQQIERNLGYK